MGPELTKVFEKMGGRKALSNWLFSPATPTIATIFRERPLGQADIPHHSRPLAPMIRTALLKQWNLI